MARARGVFYFLLGIVVFSGPVSGDSKSFDDFQKVILSQQPLQNTDLILLSFLFSGVDERDLESVTSHFGNYLQEVRSHVKPNSRNEYESGKALLAYLHETRLKRYDSSVSSMQTLWKKGKFNCLSSTMLYILGARSLGLTAEPVSAPNHVFCRLRNGETWIDVETTTKYGFHPGIRNEFFDKFGRLTGSTSLPPANYRDREVISERQLLSMMLQAELHEKDPKVLRLAIDWYTLLPTKDQRNLDYAYTYYVEWLNKEDLFDHAMKYVRHYKKRFESDPAFEKSVQVMLHRQLVAFIDKNRVRLAEQLLDEASSTLPLDLRQLLAEALLSKAMREGKRIKDYAPVLSLTSRLVANGHLPKTKGDNYSLYMRQEQVLGGK